MNKILYICTYYNHFFKCAVLKFQPIMALFRPGPNDKNRPIFNWAHWAVGMAAHILGGEKQVLSL